LCPLKTAHSERIIALDRTTVAALRAHRSRQQAERASAGEDYLDSGYVFTRLSGDPMAPDWLSRYFRQLNDDASGLPPIRLHDLRHGAASLALAAGADLKVVQDMPGHSRIVLTAGTYTPVLPEVARKTAEDIASLIIAAGCLVPGTHQRRRPTWRTLRRRAHTLITAGLSHAHPARQIAAPHRQQPARPRHRENSDDRPVMRTHERRERTAIPWPAAAHASTAV
jgi:Phage integrase family